MLEDHRPHSKAESADRRADKGYTTAAGESSSFRSETAALYHMDAPARTGKAESISAPCRPTVCKTGSFSDIQGLEIPEISDSYSDNQCQQELFFCFTGGHKAAQQEDKSEQTLM